MVHRKSWGRIVAIVILCLAVLCTPARAQFSPPKSISNNSIGSHGSFTPQVAVDSAGNIYVVWEDDTATNSNILFGRSTDGGTTFSAQKLSNSSGYSFNPRIAVDTGGGINVVWVDSPDNHYLTSNIFFSRSTDGGVTFFPTPVNLSETINPANPPFYSVPQIAVDNAGNISVVWETDDPLGLGNINLGILFSSSIDGGVTFSAPNMISTNPSGSIDPQIALDKNGNINVVWEDDIAGRSNISFSRSTDGGAHFFLTPTNLSNPQGNFMANPNSPRIAVDLGGNINVVWADTDPIHFNTEIFFIRSTDGGATFLPTPNPTPKKVSNSLGCSFNPVMAVDASGNINIVWEDTPDCRFVTSNVLFSRSSDGGDKFSPPLSISKDLGSSFNAQLALDANGNINVAWEDHAGNRDTFFTRSTDSGTSFPTIVNLSDDSGLSIAAQMAADKNGNLNVVWQDDTPGLTSRVSQIFFSRLPAEAGANQPPTIVTPPADQTVTVGQMATFSVTASGTAPLSYQWQKDGVDISGATSPSYTTPATTAQDNGAQFRVVVSNSVDTATSNVAMLTVNAPPSITSQPASQTVTVGQMAKFSVTASGTATLSYQWQKNGADISGATLDSYTTPATTTQDNGAQFRVVVSNSVGTATSNVATLTVNTPPQCSPTLRVSLSPDALWPPNHKLVQITATVETSDSCDANPAVALVSITSSEPDDGLGDGDEPNDIQPVNGGSIAFGADVQPFLLRAERSGMGTGRIYIVTYMVRDAAGNKSLASAQVSVGSQTIAASPKRSSRKK